MNSKVNRRNKTSIRSSLKDYTRSDSERTKANYSKETIEDVVSQITSRNFTNNLINNMISGGMSKPGYVFSTKASADAFREVFNPMAEDFIKSQSKAIGNYYTALSKNIEKNEIIVASKLCPLYGLPGVDPRKELKDYFNSGGNQQDEELKALMEVHGQNIAVAMVIEELEKEISQLEANPQENKRVLTMARNQLKRYQTFINSPSGLKQVETAKSLIENSKVGESSLLYSRTKQASSLAKGATGISEFVATGKGIVEEIRVGETFERFKLVNTDKIKTQVKANAIGNRISNTTSKNLINKLNSIVQGGSVTSGADTTVTTDLQIVYDNSISDPVLLNIDVKSTVTNRYQKGSKNFPINKLIDPNSNVIKGAMISLLSDINISGKVNRFTGLLKTLKVFVPMAMMSEEFVKSYFGSEQDQDKKDFQHMISINGKLYWYSELIRSMTSTDNLQDFTGKGFYNFAITLNGYENLVQAAANAEGMLNLKRRLIRIKAAQQYKTYEERYDYLMQDQALTNLFRAYWNNYSSLSLDISTRFEIKDFI